MRERIGYLLALAAVGAAVAINAVASNEVTGAEREARDIGSATREMATRWDSEHLDDARTALARIHSEAAGCRSRRATRTVAALSALETAGGDAIDNWVKALVDVHAVDGALRRGVRARLRDHDELAAVVRSPCAPSAKDRKIVRRHRQRSIAIFRASVRMKELGVSPETANRFADPALPVRELRNQVIAGN